MIERVVKKRDLKHHNQQREDLAYWLSRTPEERIAAVEFLREQYYGTAARLQRVAKVIQFKFPEADGNLKQSHQVHTSA